MRAPVPPFPNRSWFVLAGDEKGSSIELIPATAVFDPDEPLGIAFLDSRAERNGTHILIDSVKPADEVLAVARREGWRYQEVETGLFKIIKVWIDGHQLIELFALGEAERYADAFGASGLATLDGKLRALEIAMTAKLASGE